MKIETINERLVLTASEGMVLTNGTIYGTEIYLAVGNTADGFYEITRMLYNQIMKEKEEKEKIMLNGM